MPLDLNGALAALREHGLHGGISPARVPHILGGTAVSEVGGAAVYENCFSIVPRGDGWVVRAEKGERHVDEYLAANLDGAVRIVLSLRKR